MLRRHLLVLAVQPGQSPAARWLTMPSALHALDFLAAPAEQKLPVVCVVLGDDPFLKRLVLRALRRQVVGDDADVPVASYDCQERRPEWRDVADELATVSLF